MAKLILFYFLTINALGYILMLADKQRARKNLWRIPESTLFTAAALGGSIGCILGMYAFRHKTRHLRFTLGLPTILLSQVLLLLLLQHIRLQ